MVFMVLKSTLLDFKGTYVETMWTDFKTNAAKLRFKFDIVIPKKQSV